MSTIFYYPTKAAPTTTVTLPDPLPDGIVGAPEFLTGAYRTAAGVRYAYEHGGPFRLFDLRFLITDQTVFEALRDMIRDDVRGQLYEFEATVLGVDYTGCRFPTNDFSELLRTKIECPTKAIYPVNLKFSAD